ncbi:MAG: hypothetical protein MI921_05645 [Cytophagales bacterium]|nr:hypothetical protein [Cytophagales bacterium]
MPFNSLISAILIVTRGGVPDYIKGEGGTHIQITCHFEGEETTLNPIAEGVLKFSIGSTEKAFN